MIEAGRESLGVMPWPPPRPPGGEAIAAEERLEERHRLLTGRSQGPIGWRADQMDAHMLRLRGAATRVDVLR